MLIPLFKKRHFFAESWCKSPKIVTITLIPRLFLKDLMREKKKPIRFVVARVMKRVPDHMMEEADLGEPKLREPIL
jgi:hypothetical protein